MELSRTVIESTACVFSKQYTQAHMSQFVHNIDLKIVNYFHQNRTNRVQQILNYQYYLQKSLFYLR